MQKRLFILGTQTEFVGLVKKARAQGCYTVVCDGYPDGPARACADRAYTVDIHEVDRIAEICKKERIDHIVTSFSDVLFESMVLIADRAGLPCYLSPEKLELYRQKEKTKQLCDRLGIPVSRHQILRRDFSEEALRDFTFPCVVKPTDSYGSRGLSVARDVRQVRGAFEEAARFSGAPEVLVEEMAFGQELNCMAFVTDGEVHVISIADRMTASWDPERIPVNYAIRYPSRFFADAYPLVKDALQRFVHATGQTWGPISTQCFFQGERIEICEIAGRFFGFEHEMVEYSGGLDLEQLLLDLQYAPQTAKERLLAHRPEGTRYADCVYLHSIAEGVVTDQSALYEISGDPMVKETLLFYREGEKTGFFGPKQYFARFYLCADTREEVLQKEEEILDRASVLDREGKQLLLTPQRWRTS